MSSAQGNNAPQTPKAKPTERQMDLLAIIMQNVKSKPDIDWEAVAVQAGLKNKAVAVESYRQLQKKLGWSTGTSSAKSPAKVLKPTVDIAAIKRHRAQKLLQDAMAKEASGSAADDDALASDNEEAYTI